MLIAASYRGAPHHPAWYLNLIEDPDVWVRRDDELHVPVGEEERDVLWDSVVTAQAPQFADYQAATSRTIPLIRLVGGG